MGKWKAALIILTIFWAPYVILASFGWGIVPTILSLVLYPITWLWLLGIAWCLNYNTLGVPLALYHVISFALVYYINKLWRMRHAIQKH